MYHVPVIRRPGPKVAIMALMISVVLFRFYVSPVLAENKQGAMPDLRTAISDVTKSNIDAVVHIEVTQRQRIIRPQLPFQNDPFFRYFFDLPESPRSYERELKGLGSGMLIDSEGHILTNHHVVAGADEVMVLLADGNRYESKLVGTDPKTDLAVLKISGEKPFPHVSLGDSDKLEVGEWVVAIGHPRGLDQTVTQGIISAKHRRGIKDPLSYQDFLQTDAAINPGNSGGPLLNLNGEVIGVNAAIVSQSGGYEGIGFAIPSNIAVYISRALIEHGKVERGWLGVSAQDLTPDLAGSFGMSSPKGALLSDVNKGGPADRAGLKRGDIVVSFGGKEITDAASMRNEAAIRPVESKVEVTALRKGKRRTFTLTIGHKQEKMASMEASVSVMLGAKVRPVTSAEATRYKIYEKGGVAISKVKQNGPLGKVGFEVGDLILEIEGETVKGVDDFLEKASRIQPSQRVTLLALDHRRGRTGYVQVVIR